MEAILSTCGGYLATAAFWLRKDTSKASNPPISRRSTALSLRLGVLHDRAVEEGHCGVEQGSLAHGSILCLAEGSHGSNHPRKLHRVQDDLGSGGGLCQ